MDRTIAQPPLRDRLPPPHQHHPGKLEFSETASENLDRKFDKSGIPEEVLRKVLHDNAARVYHLD